ncbi:MAG: murein biosynthesis integral membrane protein MurJ, partial [Kiritimatiellae bacterium]|nr:murein biosynthesis integral membrane protein MurJ [Kiritimatiellia bacterium]
MSGTAKKAGLVGSLTLASRILGLARDMLQSRFVGGGMEQSAFTLAFLVPNLFRRLFGEGALTAAFLPVFKGEIDAGRRDEALRLARAVSTMVVCILSAFVLAGVLAAGAAGRWWQPAADAPEGRIALTLKLVRILLPYGVFICAAAFCMAALNALGRFFESSVVPCVLNIVWIAALALVAVFAPQWNAARTVSFVSMAIVAAGALQFAFLFFALRRRGYTLRPALKGWRDEKTRLVWRRTGQAAIGAGAVQISTACDQALAQMAAPWAAGVLAFANRLVELPLAIVGTAFSTVLLPVFSGKFASDDFDGARSEFLGAVRRVLSLMIPAAVGLAILAPDVVRVVFEGRSFVARDSERVARAVVCYAPGLVFFGLNKTLVPWFQAQGDVRTPVAVSIAMVAANAALNIAAVAVLPAEWRHAGIAGATVASAMGSCLLLSAAARRKNGAMGWKSLARPVAAACAAAAAMGIFAAAALSAWPAPCSAANGAGASWLRSAM